MGNYLRKITAQLPKSYKKYVSHRYLAFYLRNFLLLFLLVTAGILLQVLVNLNSRYEIVHSQNEKRVEEYKYWSGVVSQFPNIPDILYNASLSAYNAGNKNEALINIEKALKIDPLFKKAKQLRNEIISS